MDAFTLFDIANSGKMKSKVPNAAGETTRGCWLTLEYEDMLVWYVISLSKFGSEDQS